MVAGVELIYNTGASALQMAQEIFGAGVTVTGATFTGDARASAIYSGGDTISPGVVPADSGVILSTGQATRFTNDNAAQSNLATNTTSASNGPNGVADFNALAGATTFDAAFLDISFVADPNVSALTIDFVFASEEFPEFSNSVFNDVIGVWSNGQLVPIAVGSGDISVGNLNQFNAPNVFNDNTADQFNTENDGFTLTLSLTIPVNPGVANTLRIGIADTADANFDSNLLIGGASVQGDLVPFADFETITIGGTRTFDPLVNDVNETGGFLTITHINGVAVTAGDTVTLSTGQVVRLNADGTFTVTTDLDVETINFTYQVDSTTGLSATGIVEIDTIPCFVAGTAILTPDGEVPVEAVRPGDLVTTLDLGHQRVIWTGQRVVDAEGPAAPIRIAPMTFGNTRALLVSPQHRILLSSPTAELMFGEPEVLIAAKHLCDMPGVDPQPGGQVAYHHLLLDDHQILIAEGVPSESLLPGRQAINAFDDGEEDLITYAGPTPHAARRILKSYEAEVLIAAIGADQGRKTALSPRQSPRSDQAPAA